MQTPIRSSSSRRLRPVRAAMLVGALALLGACSSSGSSVTSDTTAAKGDATTPIAFKALDAGGPLTVSALDKGSVDVAVLFTFTPAIAENDWVVLEDDKELQAADNIVPVIRTDKASDDVTAVLDAVTEKLTHDDLFAMVKEVAVEGQNPDDVAKKWLEDNELPGSLTATGKITVGSANFAESAIVGNIYHQALESAGVDATLNSDVGPRQTTMPLLESGDLDLMPEFTYSLLAYLDSSAEPSNDLDKVMTDLTAALEGKGLTALEPTDINDVNVLVVTQETADKYDLSTISDLAGVTDSITLGGPPECPKNAQCILGLESVYGLSFDVD